jgi:hypothetical protein
MTLFAFGAITVPHIGEFGGATQGGPGTAPALNSQSSTLGDNSLPNPSSSLYLLNFTEMGLPSNTVWTVNLSGQLSFSNLSSIALWEGNGTWPWSASSPGYNASPARGNLTVSGSPTGVVVTFTANASTAYAVTFTDNGTVLPNGTLWGVETTGPAGTWLVENDNRSVGVSLTNGSYNYTIIVVGIPNITALPNSGTFLVAGAMLSFGVTFEYLEPQYAVRFTETGLPADVDWTVSLSGDDLTSNTTSVTYFEPNGTYSFEASSTSGYGGIPASGTVTVNGTSFGVTITFVGSPTTYPVTIRSIGLVNGTEWQLNMTGTSSGTMIVSSNNLTDIGLSNGSYVFTVAPLPGFTATYNSTVIIQGAGATFSVVFTPNSNTSIPSPSYPVTVTETGLPDGTNWSAALGGAVSSSNIDSITFIEPNGTYTLTVSPVANFSAIYSSQVSIEGGPLSLGVAFSPSIYSVAFTESGLSAGMDWTVTATNAVTQHVVSGQSTQRTITVQLEDGSYTITASGPVGYVVSLSASVIAVGGTSPVAVTVAFTPTPVSITSPSTIPGLTTGILVITAVVGILGAVWGYARYQYGQRRSRALRWIREFETDAAEVENLSED